MENILAIVIPAYKSTYFKASLESIANQTNKNFKLYICDDGSKENLFSIAEEYKNKINFVYKRFEDNIGGKDLVAHWNRSVALAKEKWIWLFSDDDLLTPNCVQAFFDALNNTASTYNIYRFNIEMIDSKDQVICVKERHPELESNYDFLTRRLQARCLSAVIEYVFRKDVFEELNGFVNFPLATASDDASWIMFSKDKPIFTISSDIIYWRSSGANISSKKGLQEIKAKALIEFVHWMLNYFPAHKEEILGLTEAWYYESLKYIGGKLSVFVTYKIAKEFTNIYPVKKTSYFFWRIFLVKPSN